jgi:hypothetical protein
MFALTPDLDEKRAGPLVGERDELHEITLFIQARHPVYIRPAIHLDPYWEQERDDISEWIATAIVMTVGALALVFVLHLG